MTRITSRPFGATGDGAEVRCFTLENERGLSAEVLNYGGILRALHVPVSGAKRDVVLGFDCVEDYIGQDKYIGAIVGRVANRIGDARFSLDGRAYGLDANSGRNTLHGGTCGFHEKVWTWEISQAGALILSCVSPHLESGFPGTLRVTVTYALTDDCGLSIAYAAQTDSPTPVNLTNHSYFCLNGQGCGTIEHHKLQVFADQMTENGIDGVPTGRRLDVAGTPFDLRTAQPLWEGLASTHPQMRSGGGYDHNFVLSTCPSGPLRLAAVVEAGGLRMDCATTQPGVQVYTAQYLAGERGKDGAAYPPRSGLCLETQNWPDAVNQPDFPNAILLPGEIYRQETVYRFTQI